MWNACVFLQSTFVVLFPALSNPYTILHRKGLASEPPLLIRLHIFTMPLLRSLTTKIKTAISPSSSPTSPRETSSGFEVLAGRKETDHYAVKRPETNARMDSFIIEESAQEWTHKKQRRVSRFREELGLNEE
jgi:hypothetical protein